MIYSSEVEHMCPVAKGAYHGPAPIPEEGKWVQAKQISDISGLPIGASLEDLGKGLRSQIGTMFGTKLKGARYLEMAEGYVTQLALNADNEIIGYEFLNLGKFTDALKKGEDPAAALEKAKGRYGQFADAVKYIDPRKE